MSLQSNFSSNELVCPEDDPLRAELPLDQDIPDLQALVWLEYPEPLAQRGGLVQSGLRTPILITWFDPISNKGRSSYIPCLLVSGCAALV